MKSLSHFKNRIVAGLAVSTATALTIAPFMLKAANPSWAEETKYNTITVAVGRTVADRDRLALPTAVTLSATATKTDGSKVQYVQFLDLNEGSSAVVSHETNNHGVEVYTVKTMAAAYDSDGSTPLKYKESLSAKVEGTDAEHYKTDFNGINSSLVDTDSIELTSGVVYVNEKASDQVTVNYVGGDPTDGGSTTIHVEKTRNQGTRGHQIEKYETVTAATSGTSATIMWGSRPYDSVLTRTYSGLSSWVDDYSEYFVTVTGQEKEGYATPITTGHQLDGWTVTYKKNLTVTIDANSDYPNEPSEVTVPAGDLLLPALPTPFNSLRDFAGWVDNTGKEVTAETVADPSITSVRARWSVPASVITPLPALTLKDTPVTVHKGDTLTADTFKAHIEGVPEDATVEYLGGVDTAEAKTEAQNASVKVTFANGGSRTLSIPTIVKDKVAATPIAPLPTLTVKNTPVTVHKGDTLNGDTYKAHIDGLPADATVTYLDGVDTSAAKAEPQNARVKVAFANGGSRTLSIPTIVKEVETPATEEKPEDPKPTTADASTQTDPETADASTQTDPETTETSTQTDPEMKDASTQTDPETAVGTPETRSMCFLTDTTPDCAHTHGDALTWEGEKEPATTEESKEEVKAVKKLAKTGISVVAFMILASSATLIGFAALKTKRARS